MTTRQRVLRFVSPGPRLLRGGLAAAACVVLAVASTSPAQARGAQHWPILHHGIHASVEPSAHRLAVTDTLELGSPPKASAPLRLLLHRDLKVEWARLIPPAETTAGGSSPAAATGSETGVRAGPEGSLVVEESRGFRPRHFWDHPDYERMEDYAAARELTLRPPAEGWPDRPRIVMQYAGAVYDSLHPPKVAYSRGFETTTGLVDERGAYLAGSTFWIPWNGEDLFRFRLTASVPPGWESVSQGKWASRKVADDGRVESVWVVKDPMSEAYLIAGPYLVRSADADGVTAYTFTYHDTPEDLCRTYLDATGKYLRFYGEMIGPYPFEKFALVENWWQTGFGMPSFTLLGSRVIRLPFIVHTSYGHEILHDWWGNGVFVDYEQGNWCEGLTTYLADYTYKRQESPEAAREYRLSRLQAYLDYAATGGRDFPLRRFTERENASTQAVGYGKTMMVFHMARRRMGDDDFFAGLRRFYKDYLFRKASWDDLVGSFEKATGRSWADWFEQWIGRPGAPVLSVSRVEEGPGGTDASGSETGPWIEIRQEEPYYDLRVPVQYETGDTVTTREVALDGASARLHLPAGTRWVAVDPDFDIFRKLHRGEIPPTLSQVLGADSTVVVLGSHCPVSVRRVLPKLAWEWGRNQNMIVVDEADFTGPDGRGVWLFGDGEWVDRVFARTRAFGTVPGRLRRAAADAHRALVACFRDPDHPEIPWTVFLPTEASVVMTLGRKLPHYGHYSYLVFDGEEKVDGGRWVVTSSPLRLDFSGGER